MKPITKVFLVIGALALCLILWVWVFDGGGILTTAYNAAAGVVNDVWQNITGTSDDLLPELESTDDNLDSNKL